MDEDLETIAVQLETSGTVGIELQASPPFKEIFHGCGQVRSQMTATGKVDQDYPHDTAPLLASGLQNLRRVGGISASLH